MTELESTRKDGPLWNLGTAAMLGASWTWCIGMFLPVLLVRDLGIGGFVVFAVPNVVGAAAMGWVLKDAGTSRRVQAEHAAACTWFSAVTVAFHVFFVCWIGYRVAGPWAVFAFCAAVGVVILAARGSWGWRATAAAALVISAGAMAVGFARGDLPRLAERALSATAEPDRDVLFLAPVCLFGFFLCPYLDLTFHKARQETTPAGGRFAFGFGFGVLFLAMILFTVCYSGWLAGPFDRRLHAAIAIVLAVHLLVQAGYTCAIHFDVNAGRWANARARAIGAVILLLCVLLGAADHGWAAGMRYQGFSVGEIVYRCFLAFYGLVFPAYVWLRMVPARDGTVAKPDVANLRWAVAVLLAAPMYWMGFIERRMVWLVPGVLVVLAARVGMDRAKRTVAVLSSMETEG